MNFSLLSFILAAASTAEAFTTQKPTAFSTSLKSYESELGAIDPVGTFACVPHIAFVTLTLGIFAGFFDPAGLTADIDEDKFRRYRAGEIKNGRAAMLAVIGYIVPEFYRFPGELYPGLKFADIPNGACFYV